MPVHLCDQGTEYHVTHLVTTKHLGFGSHAEIARWIVQVLLAAFSPILNTISILNLHGVFLEIGISHTEASLGSSILRNTNPREIPCLALEAPGQRLFRMRAHPESAWLRQDKRRMEM